MTAYETGQDLLAETCRERWAAQFDWPSPPLADGLLAIAIQLSDPRGCTRFDGIDGMARHHYDRARRDWLDALPPPRPGTRQRVGFPLGAAH